MIFCGEIAATDCESLLFTRDAVLIGRLLRTLHMTHIDAAEPQRQQQRATVKRDELVTSDKRTVRVWRDGVEVKVSAPLNSSRVVSTAAQ